MANDLVERLAQSQAEIDGRSLIGMSGADRKRYMLRASDAIAIVVEEAAKVAERAGGDRVGAADSNQTRTVGSATDAATAIRKMGESE